jgi:hypothetical protein
MTHAFTRSKIATFDTKETTTGGTVMRPAPRASLVVLVLALLAATAGTAVAAAPPNDNRANATPLGVPVKVSGTTAGATEEPRDPQPPCGPVKATVWYRLSVDSSGRVVLRFAAGGDLDAIVSVYRLARSRLFPLACDTTDERGRAALSFDAAPGKTYLIMVGREPSSDDGPFRFRLFRAQPSSAPPGKALPRHGVRSSVDALSDFDDAWSLRMRPGVTYRLNLAPRGSRCVGLSLYRPHTRSFAGAAPIRVLGCGGYFTYTPDAGEGGRYSLLVTATGTRPGRERYHLQAALAGGDDMAPGLRIRNLHTRRGSLSARGIDVVDLYRFRVLNRSDVTVTLGAGASFRLILLSETGRHLSASDGPGRLTTRLAPGRYFVAVRAESRARGRYRLSLLERRITTTRVSVDGERVAKVAPGSSVAIGVAVNFSPAGKIRLELDRFDPLTGWHFYRLYRLRLHADGRTGRSWRPPAIGRWRVRAWFRGTGTASPSAGGGALIVVVDT